jgi:REP element-mobilizing transposase RayT
MTKRKTVQLEFPARGRGGRRRGAGRPKGHRVSHLTRVRFPERFPLHVTLKIRADVGSLRTDKRFRRIQRAFRYGCDRFGMRMVEFSVQGNHIHLIVEAEDQKALARGMQGLAIRLAKGINRLSNRKGQIFSDRYHARVLRTPTEVRNAVEYVRHNQKKHVRKAGRQMDERYIDPYSSMSGEALWYVDQHGSSMVVAAPKTWPLRSAGGFL